MFSFYSSLTSRIRRRDEARRSVQFEISEGEEDEPLSPQVTSSSMNNCGYRPHMFKHEGSMGEGLDEGDSEDGQSVIGSFPSEERRRSSSADSESAQSWDFNWKDVIFDPDGPAYYYWLAVSAMAAMYNCGILIVRLAFPELREGTSYQSLFTFCDYLSDVIYLIDIGVHLRTAYLEDGIMVLDPEKLKQNYIQKKDFKLAVLSLVPVGSAVVVLSRIGSVFGIRVVDQVYSPITRIHRLLKYHVVPKFFEITDSQTSNPNVVRAFKLSLYLWIVIHWIGCFYYMVSEYEGLGSTEWVYPSSPDSQRLSRKYILCFYWSMMTLTTIGERQPPESDIEYIFTGLTFLIGVFVFAAVVGNVGDVISNMNAARQDYVARMDQIKFYMNHRNVPTFLQNRVKRWANYSWTRTQAIDEASLLEMLPERIRTEIAIHTNLDTLKKVQIFEECEEGLLQELVLKLRPQIFSPRDYICRIGEIGREMYIINHGKVEILVKNPATGDKMVVATLMAGNYFGEISLLKLDAGQNRRTADVRSVGYSELLCLSRKDLITALVEYPDAKVILEKKAHERMQMNKQVRRKSGPDEESEEENVQRTAPKSSRALAINQKSRLADVIRSTTFQNLISKRGKEMTELKDLINELKAFDSQATKLRIQQLSEKCESLMGQLRTRDTELQQAIKRIAELEQVILGPAKRKWMSVELNGVKVSDVREEDSEDADMQDFALDIFQQPSERNENCVHLGSRNLAGTNGNTHPSNGQLRPSNGLSQSCHLVCTGPSQPANATQSQRVTDRLQTANGQSQFVNNQSKPANVHSQLENVKSQPANSRMESLTIETQNNGTASVVPEINHNCERTVSNDSEDTNLTDVFGNGDEIDLSDALFAMMSMGESQSLSDVSNSNSESNASSDVDSDAMDL